MFILSTHTDLIKHLKLSIESLKLNTYCHSEKKIPNKDIDIYFVDTYGETKSFFQISKTVFLGGSIIKHGGQNPLEAIRFGCKVLHGPNVKNFKEIYNLLKLYNLSLKINNINQLINALKQSFSHNSNSEKKIKKLKKMGLKILNITYAKLGYYIKKNEIKKT